MQTALVTGGNGFVGKHLVQYLLDNKYEVGIFDAAQGDDIRNYEEIRQAVFDLQPDLIFHLAAQAFVPETTTAPRRGFEVNTLGTLNLLEAVRHTGSRARVHLAGTSAEYGYQLGDEITEETLPAPDTPYGVSKLAATHLGLNYASLYKMNVVVTRAFNHTGPGHQSNYAIPSFSKQVAEIELGQREYIQHGDLSAVRNYTDVRDVIRAYHKAIFLEPGIYNVCSPNTVTMEDVLKTLVYLANVRVELRTDEGLYRLGYTTGPDRLAKPNCEKLKNATGWQPEITLKDTLLDTLNYWRQQVAPYRTEEGSK